MNIKAGEWKKLRLLDKADLLIKASNNNAIGYALRKRKEQKNKPQTV